MGDVRKGIAAVGVVLAAALIAGLASYVMHTQSQARDSLRDSLERRAALTGRLIGSALMTANNPKDARARFGGSPGALVRRVSAAGADGATARLLVLDAGGRVLASSPAPTSRDRGLIARSPHLRAALRGAATVSDGLRDARGRSLIELAVPFETRWGRRVLVVAAPVEVLRKFTDGFFASASALPGARGFLLDGGGQTLAANGGRGAGDTPPDARLSAALQAAPAGTYGDRTFVAASVPSSRWRVVLTVPTDQLYASVDGGPGRVTWLLFAAFSAAICALLALGVAAVRSARRLAGATERERAASELAHERLHDALTGLPNRTLFQDRADHAIALAQRRRRSVAVVFMDIDHFKRINDSLGHDAGDTVLREVARRLDHSVRAVDTVSRFGGDEFVMLCEDVEDNEVPGLVARIEQALSAPVAIGDRRVPVSFSIGVALHRAAEPVRTAGDLVREADTAMYRAKELGRGRVEVFDSQLHQQAVARLDAEVALRRAIDDEELIVFYQPIVSLGDGVLRGVEALVRWQRPGTAELVPPGEFIPLAEETGLIGEIDDWVLRTAVREVGGWIRDGLVDDDIDLSVNVSACQLADPALAEAVAAALGGWDRPPDRLCLEITETAVMADPVTAERTLAAIHGLGVRLALDDFGVGHSSLGQLARSLPIAVLKLDRSFVAGMAEPRDRGIVQAAASLAQALDLASVAEGVESAEQAQQLEAMGFPYAQGFHFGRPMDSAQFVERFRRPALA